MNRVFNIQPQPCVNNFCCCSTASLACIDGNIIGLFIPNVIRHTRKLWVGGWQHVPLNNSLRLYLVEIKKLLPRWSSKDFSSILCERIQVPEFSVGLDRTLSLSAFLHCS